MADNENGAVHLQAAIENAIDQVRDLVSDETSAVVAEYPAHLPAVDGDEESLVQIISSLIAFVMTRSDRTEVYVRAHINPSGTAQSIQGRSKLKEIDDRGPWAIVSVADVQASVPLNVIELEAIQTEGEASDHSFPSLIDCSRWVEELGGELWAESEEDLGYRIQFALPLRATRDSTTDVSAIRRAVETRLPETEQESKRLLLMVEDQEMRDLLTTDLVDAGYSVVVPSAGGEVLSSAKTESPDLIILDLLSHDPAALDIARVLKQERMTQSIPVLFLTTTSSPEGEVRMGAANFMVRPKGTGALLATVNAVLHSGLSPASRVLVVEPNDVVRENIIMMIQAHGYPVAEARAPEEALALAERFPIGLVLANADLSQERDYWLLRQLRGLPRDIDIFVLADALTDEEGRAAISRGASGYSETGKLRDLLDRVRNQKGAEKKSE